MGIWIAGRRYEVNSEAEIAALLAAQALTKDAAAWASWELGLIKWRERQTSDHEAA